ncbi:MAG: glycosyltransferase family 2 protein [Gammaproteobacteria bacterium]|nr:glycosyltransferase family 2 protein [Gammaproteobacteria bacterium]
MDTISIVLPCLNEEANLTRLLPKLNAAYPDAEIIVVNDGSDDNSEKIAIENGARVINHAYRMGNGAAIKTGARHVTGSITVFMDADGQHNPIDIARLVEKVESGYEMAVGARRVDTHATFLRRIANTLYNRLASYMVGHQIDDLTSGFRAVRTRHFRKFLYLLPNGFSYPTTSTMAFFRSGFPVCYVPINAGVREGKSKIKLLRDGTRFFIIIIKIGSLFSPMKLFLPLSFVQFSLGLWFYLYTYVTTSHFSNASIIFFLSSITTFLIGILSEQISSLHYRGVEEDRRKLMRNNDQIAETDSVVSLDQRKTG